MKQVFKSMIHEFFSPELLARMEFITRQVRWTNNEKKEEIMNKLEQSKLPWSSLGAGTNRYGILLDGYAFKIGLDRAGHIDNLREKKYGKSLYPGVVKIYEASENGLLANFEYGTIFDLDDFYTYQNEMRKILERITNGYMVGDVGISTANYINWIKRCDGSIAIMDFAYIYSLSYRSYLCDCPDEGNLEYDEDFNYLVCPFCKKKYSFIDIRRRISRKAELEEIGDILKTGYVLTQPYQEMEINPDFSPVKKKKAKKNKVEKKPDVYEELENMNQKDALDEINRLIGC